MSDMEEALPIIDYIAPEHLELAVEAPEALANKIQNAGAIFLGRYTPEALGDYIAGPNHVLPTDRSAKFSSGLGVFNFMKRTSLIGASPGSARGRTRSGNIGRSRGARRPCGVRIYQVGVELR